MLIETFILFDDKVGQQLQQVLVEAAERGVQVTLSLDGFGSGELGLEFINRLINAGIHLQFFDAAAPVMGVRTNWFRRLHRKIVVVDGTLAFVGGINFSADHLADFGPEAKQDYAVVVSGPVVVDIHHFALQQSGLQVPRRFWFRRRLPHPQLAEPSSEQGQIRLVYRDNHQHRSDIEEHYLQVLRDARQRIIIANAYFFPGYRLLREIRNAARRGVEVRLILQGQPDMPIVKLAARMLYDYLLKDDVRIYEYCDRPLHGKVALVDDEWSTVGSSNLDPLSLSLNLEANLMVRDRAFNQVLYERLDNLCNNHCKVMDAARGKRGLLWRTTIGFVIFHFLRHFPSWAGWLPAHKPRLRSFRANTEGRTHD